MRETVEKSTNYELKNRLWNELYIILDKLSELEKKVVLSSTSDFIKQKNFNSFSGTSIEDLQNKNLDHLAIKSHNNFEKNLDLKSNQYNEKQTPQFNSEKAQNMKNSTLVQRPNIAGWKLKELEVWFNEKMTVKSDGVGERISEICTNYKTFYTKKGKFESDLISKRQFGDAMVFLLQTIKNHPEVFISGKREKIISHIELTHFN